MSNGWLNSLVLENPMLIEVRRFTRKFIGVGSNSTVATAVMVLAGIAYAGLLLVVANWSGDIDPITLIWFEAFVLMVGIPIGLHAAIAGEREKRTWDLLLVAPLTKAQIVAGKFISGAAAITGTVALFLVPIAISSVSYAFTHYYNTLLAQLLVFSFALLVTAMTLFFSARASRGLMALGLSLGTLFVLLLVIPMMVLPVFDSESASEMMLFLHPVFTLIRIGAAGARARYGGDVTFGDEVVWPDSMYGWPQIIAYLVLTVLFLVWAERTLTYAESDKRFLRKTSSA